MTIEAHQLSISFARNNEVPESVDSETIVALPDTSQFCAAFAYCTRRTPAQDRRAASSESPLLHLIFEEPIKIRNGSPDGLHDLSTDTAIRMPSGGVIIPRKHVGDEELTNIQIIHNLVTGRAIATGILKTRASQFKIEGGNSLHKEARMLIQAIDRRIEELQRPVDEEQFNSISNIGHRKQKKPIANAAAVTAIVLSAAFAPIGAAASSERQDITVVDQDDAEQPFNPQQLVEEISQTIFCITHGSIENQPLVINEDGEQGPTTVNTMFLDDSGEIANRCMFQNTVVVAQENPDGTTTFIVNPQSVQNNAVPNFGEVNDQEYPISISQADTEAPETSINAITQALTIVENGSEIPPTITQVTDPNVLQNLTTFVPNMDGNIFQITPHVPEGFVNTRQIYWNGGAIYAGAQLDENGNLDITVFSPDEAEIIKNFMGFESELDAPTGINIRQVPTSIGNEPIGKTEHGIKYTFLGIADPNPDIQLDNNVWYEVEFSGKVGYIAGLPGVNIKTSYNPNVIMPVDVFAARNQIREFTGFNINVVGDPELDSEYLNTIPPDIRSNHYYSHELGGYFKIEEKNLLVYEPEHGFLRTDVLRTPNGRFFVMSMDEGFPNLKFNKEDPAVGAAMDEMYDEFLRQITTAGLNDGLDFSASGPNWGRIVDLTNIPLALNNLDNIRNRGLDPDRTNISWASNFMNIEEVDFSKPPKILLISKLQTGGRDITELDPRFVEYHAGRTNEGGISTDDAYNISVNNGRILYVRYIASPPQNPDELNEEYIWGGGARINFKNFSALVLVPTFGSLRDMAHPKAATPENTVPRSPNADKYNKIIDKFEGNIFVIRK